MSRGAQTFKQADVTKAVKAVVKAGVKVASVVVAPDGRIVVVTGERLKGEEIEDVAALIG